MKKKSPVRVEHQKLTVFLPFSEQKKLVSGRRAFGLLMIFSFHLFDRSGELLYHQVSMIQSVP